MNTVELILNFFTSESAVENATAMDIIELQDFCKKLINNPGKIEKYVSSLSLDDPSKLEQLEILIWKCGEQLLQDWDKYEEMLEIEPGSFDEGTLEELEEEYMFYKNEKEELERTKKTIGHLDAPYSYVSEEGVVEETTDIDLAIHEATRHMDESDIYSFECEMLGTGYVSDAIEEALKIRKISLEIFSRYKNMTPKIYRADVAKNIKFEEIVGQLVDYLSGQDLFDRPIDKDSLLGLLNLCENYNVYKVKRGKKVYVYAFIRMVSDKMAGKIGLPRDFNKWRSQAYAYFELEDYHKTHSGDYLTRNDGGGGVNKFVDGLDAVLDVISKYIDGE